MICQLKCGEDKEEEDHSRNREEYVQRTWDKEKIKIESSRNSKEIAIARAS